jgi:ribosomal protein S2
MKIKKFKFKQILKLHLLKSRTYEQFVKKNNFDYLIDVNLNQTITNIKKALHIIFKYDETGKRVLFIGIPKKLEYKINKITNHVAVPSNFNVQGLISSDLKSLKSKENNKQILFKTHSNLLFPKLLSKPDLVVIFSHDKKHNTISESYRAKIPVITLDNDLDSRNTWYSNPSNPQETPNSINNDKHIFFIGLNFLFKMKSKTSRKQKNLNK